MPLSPPITATIQKRFSCRTYDKSPIQEKARASLAAYAASLHMGPFGNPLRFVLVSATEKDRSALRGLGTYGFIKDATGFVIGAMGRGARNLEDFGYLMEQIVLHATQLDLGTCWLGGSFTKSRFARKIEAASDETVPAVTSVGRLPDKPGTRDTLVRGRTGAHHRLPWQNLFFDNEFGRPLTSEQAGDYATVLEMVRIGPSASNKQPWRIVRQSGAYHLYVQRTPGYRAGRLMRLMKVDDMQRLDMGIAMCHFELSARELGLHGTWVVEKPDLLLPDALTEYTVTWLVT